MSKTLDAVIQLVNLGEVKISDHGYDELAEDGLFVKDVILLIDEAVVIEDYPEYHKGPCVLVLQKDGNGNAIHVVWGIPKGKSSPAVLITSYSSDPTLWTDGFMRRMG
jgi:hypothetical protein